MNPPAPNFFPAGAVCLMRAPLPRVWGGRAARPQCVPGVGGVGESLAVATSGGGWVMKDGSCTDERGASFREAGPGSSLIPSTSIQIPFV